MEEGKGQEHEHETAHRQLIRGGFDFDRQQELRQIVVVPDDGSWSWPALRRASQPGNKRDEHPFVHADVAAFTSPVPYYMFVRFSSPDLWVASMHLYVLRDRAAEHDLYCSWTRGFADFGVLRTWRREPSSRPADVRVIELDSL